MVVIYAGIPVFLNCLAVPLVLVRSLKPTPQAGTLRELPAEVPAAPSTTPTFTVYPPGAPDALYEPLQAGP